MLSTILTTKLYIPPPPPKVVFRPRLIERLNESLAVGHTAGVTLISAPAGFGKTTLISEWAAGSGRQVAWLSLDEGDNNPTRFLTYVVAALRTAVPNFGDEVLGALQSQQPTEPILTVLLNEIDACPDQTILVLDDYHMVDAKPVDLALTFLIEHLPPRMQLVITTREDPQLPLARLRSRGRLTELRAADLRFTPAEAAEFLNQVMSLNLSAADIAALEDRTEGWIAGLQLAALSMRGHQDIPGFIQAFAGDQQYIVDYLVEEVLQRQPETIRSFLLQTSILDRLNGPLCDAVSGLADSSKRLEELQHGNFFIVSLDDKCHWYRYHHLFAEVLYLHLMAEQPDQVPALHRRASEWYEQNGLAADAIRHALAGKDFERAADLVELAVPAMRKIRLEATILGWLKTLPDELFQRRPVLSDHYAGALLQTGELDRVEVRLRDAERWLDKPVLPQTPPAEMIVVDKEEFGRLPGSVAVHRAGQALMLGDVDGTVKYARRALNLVPEDDHLGRGAALALLGLASWRGGNLREANRSYADSMIRLQQAGHFSDVLGCALALADIRIGQGRLGEAMRTFEQGLQLSKDQGPPVLRGTADMYVGKSELLRERNELTASLRLLQTSKELGEFSGLPQNRYRWRAAMARIREAQGDLDGALELLHEAERLYVGDFSPNVRPIAAMMARVWVAQGRLGEAFDWAHKQGLSAEDNLSYLREYEHITLARILLARCKSDPSERSMLETTGLLERLLKEAQTGGRDGSTVEILVLQALAHEALGDIPAALLPLSQALTLAEAEGYIRKFLDEGPPMARLLLEAAAHGIMPDYTGKLLAAFKAEQQPALPQPQAGMGQDHTPMRKAGESPRLTSPASRILIEPLSQRELDILRLFKTELSGPEIAGELVIALSTVRTHTKSIFGKLDVNSRRAAVKRAEELDLI